MKWIQYKVYTTTDAAEIIGELLCELGIQGFEISDHVPLTLEEEKQMYTDIPADLGPDDGKSVLTFYTEGDNDPQEREFLQHRLFSAGCRFYSGTGGAQSREADSDSPPAYHGNAAIFSLCRSKDILFCSG